jgi:hypothetical protein
VAKKLLKHLKLMLLHLLKLHLLLTRLHLLKLHQPLLLLTKLHQSDHWPLG